MLKNRLDLVPPEDGRPAAEVLHQAVHDVLPFAARLDHPRSFGFVPSSPTWPGVVADFLAGFNINSCIWLVSSGTSQLELIVVDRVRGWIGYPERCVAATLEFVATTENWPSRERTSAHG